MSYPIFIGIPEPQVHKALVGRIDEMNKSVFVCIHQNGMVEIERCVKPEGEDTHEFKSFSLGEDWVQGEEQPRQISKSLFERVLQEAKDAVK